MTGPKNKNGEPTWGGLADEVRYWGEWVLVRRSRIIRLYGVIACKKAETSRSTET
jgi:putative DNA methylase